MSKVLDITDKLNFEQKPVIKIKDTEIEVNNDAISFIKVAALFDGKDIKPADMLTAIDLLFDDDSKAKVTNLHLSFDSLAKVIQTATSLVAKEDVGEDVTPATT